MSPGRIVAVMQRHFYEARHNLDRAADVLFWPLLDVVTWGLFSLYLERNGYLKGLPPEFLLAGIILWGAFRAGQRDIALGFLAEIWARNIIGLFASPLRMGELLVALVAIDLCKVILALGLAVGVVAAVYGNRLALLLPGLLPALLILMLFATGVGLVVTSLVLRFSSRVQTLAYGIAGLLMPFSCVFYPLSALPGPLRAVAWGLPSTHAFEDMRSVLAGRGDAGVHLAWGFGLALGALMLALLQFRHTLLVVRRRGSLVRLD